ncbi:hypothetical protein FGG08_007053 [Glutinoglossum americanum]|uniref:Nucleoside phosphorylase domain-containing protein n=1 Tax=Glutinoglossum americanum TaxID=1670608 RepID=A0A9P8HRI1_9PEZI|nr:hypothetical protein FGG08_007053 [Glutinoglossum americanum]
MGNRRLRREDYTIGWVCALPIELAAAQEMLDEEHQAPRDVADTNLYSLGCTAGHNVVIACLPAGRIGTNSAATVAIQMKSTFTAIRFGLMVGIGGGVPSGSDVRLGDVVISQPSKGHGGVIQYDMGKTTSGGFERTSFLNAPPTTLLNALTQLQANYNRSRSSLSTYMSVFNRLPKFTRSNAGDDITFEADYSHVGGPTCNSCDRDRLVKRSPREEEVVVHYGTIASGNQVIKDGVTRDRLSSDYGGVLCFEMEAAGLMNDFPCLVIRGICDYADSHKNKKWQPYAAAAAAACAKEVLSVIPVAEVATTRIASQVIDGQEATDSSFNFESTTESHYLSGAWHQTGGESIYHRTLPSMPTRPAIGGAPSAKSTAIRRWSPRESRNPASDRGSTSASGHITTLSRKTFPSGIKILYEAEDSAVDIIFVHGLTGDREETWTARDATAPWPQTLLPFKVPNSRVLTFGYDAYVVDWQDMVSENRIGNHAMNLLNAIAIYREDDGTNKRPIIFVCHGLGGLVCEDALVTAQQPPERHLRDILNFTYGIIFLGTPHRGAALADWAEILAKSIELIRHTNPHVISVLRKDSEVLSRIPNNFHTLIRSRNEDGLPPIKITCFYEELPLPGVGMVVSRDSAILAGYNYIGIPDNHHGMTKFDNRDDPGFIAVAGQLRRWVNEVISSSSRGITEAGQMSQAESSRRIDRRPPPAGIRNGWDPQPAQMSRYIAPKALEQGGSSSSQLKGAAVGFGSAGHTIGHRTDYFNGSNTPHEYQLESLRITKSSLGVYQHYPDAEEKSVDEASTRSSSLNVPYQGTVAWRSDPNLSSRTSAQPLLDTNRPGSSLGACNPAAVGSRRGENPFGRNASTEKGRDLSSELKSCKKQLKQMIGPHGNWKSPNILNSAEEIAGIYEKQGKFDKALKWYGDIYTERKNTLGKQDPATLRTRASIANCYEKKGWYEYASKWR